MNHVKLHYLREFQISRGCQSKISELNFLATGSGSLTPASRGGKKTAFGRFEPREFRCVQAPSSMMTSPSSREGSTTGDASKLLDSFHEAAASSNESVYFSCFSSSPTARFLGSDGKENWTVEEFRLYAKPHFAAGNGWVYKPLKRKIEISNLSDATAIACFDEHLLSEKWGHARGTGVLTLEDNHWKIMQYHLSFPIPNELAPEITKTILKHSHTQG